MAEEEFTDESGAVYTVADAILNAGRIVAFAVVLCAAVFVSLYGLARWLV